MSDDQTPAPSKPIPPNKPGLDPNVRVILGRQLRNYYDRMSETSASESLAQLLRQFEANTDEDSEHPAGPQAGAA
ncbi:MAG: hypothetical protein ACRECV_05940 [Xanthobacteraceae bacterium]